MYPTSRVLENQPDSYSVETPIFEGPLDLLLQLIERAELDITRLSLAQVTDQYLAHLKHIQDREAEEVSTFLVIASRLLQIKSEMLLPKPPSLDEGEEETGNDLAHQLLVYKRYKEVASHLGKREKSGLRTYLSMASPPEFKTYVDSGKFSLDDLVTAARNILTKFDNRSGVNTVVIAPKITIKEKITQITKFIRRYKRGTFSSLFLKKASNTEIVVTFLALLELIKRHLIVAEQGSLFGEIEISSSEYWDESESFEFDIEFDE